MNAVSATTSKRIEAQGYVGLSDATLIEVGPWLRFAPAVCMTWVAIATAFASAIALWALMPFAAVGAIFTGHPFEVVYNHGIRHVLGKPHLPPARAPRRFAALVHESELARNDPNPPTCHRPVAYDAGLPIPVIRLRMLHATTASVTRPPGERARRPPPMIALYRKKAFSTRACR